MRAIKQQPTGPLPRQNVFPPSSPRGLCPVRVFFLPAAHGAFAPSKLFSSQQKGPLPRQSFFPPSSPRGLCPVRVFFPPAAHRAFALSELFSPQQHPRPLDSWNVYRRTIALPPTCGSRKMGRPHSSHGKS